MPTSENSRPPLDLFLRGAGGSPGGKGKWQNLIQSMRPNEPQLIPEIRVYNDTSAMMLHRAARKMGRRLVLRTVDGRVWGCWVTDANV